MQGPVQPAASSQQPARNQFYASSINQLIYFGPILRVGRGLKRKLNGGFCLVQHSHVLTETRHATGKLSHVNNLRPLELG